ncbi:unnamed protein product [Lupinus luteus]|uniref:Metallothionein n=1 Tax=Lupinus luteus TaxID=3873 RepID=A0AAV1XDB6_LUPLU
MMTKATPVDPQAIECTKSTDCIGTPRCCSECLPLCKGGVCKCTCPSTKFHV